MAVHIKEEKFGNQEPDIAKNAEKHVNANAENKEVTFDDLISSAGEFGLYQVLLFFSTLPFYFFGVVVYFTQLFLTEVSPNHWCWIPELANLTALERRNLAIPADENSRFGYSQCQMYVANWTEILQYGLESNHNITIASCQHGWEFNKTEIPYATISSELEWVCEKNSYQASAQAIFFLGSISGGFIIGKVSDKFGRLPASVAANVIGCIGGVASIFARNFLEFAVCRFITGLAYDNCMVMVYLLQLEYVAPKYRTLISNTSFALFYSTSVTLLPWLVLACGHWKTVSLVTSLPLLLAILCPFCMPESARWLLSKGRVDQAVKKILTIGRINKKEVPLTLIEKFKISNLNKNTENNTSILEMMKRPVLRKMFISICLEYTCGAIVFDGLVRSIQQLDFDFFVSFSVISVTEFPSVLLLAFILDWVGRKWLVIIAFLVTITFTVLTSFVNGIVSVCCAWIARFAINTAYGASMQWGPEMLPVSVRGSGVAIIHTCAFFGYILAPYIVYLENFIHWLPSVILGVVCLIGIMLALILPETARKDLPQSFDDAEYLIKNQETFSMPWFSSAASETKQSQA